MKSLFPSLFRQGPKSHSRRKADVAFSKWTSEATKKEVQDLLRESLSFQGGGHTRTIYNSSRASDPNMPVGKVVDDLTSLHDTTQREVIRAAAPAIETLIVSHAHFPFTDPIHLDTSAIDQSITLITSCNASFWKFEVPIAGKDGERVVRTRGPEQHLRFIYSALAHPPTGSPNKDDILDVLCKMQYPYFLGMTTVESMRSLNDLEPLAERLEPSVLEEPVALKALPVDQLVSLQRIAKTFPPKHLDGPTDYGFGDVEEMNVADFTQWAIKVHLLEALAELFSVLIQHSSLRRARVEEQQQEEVAQAEKSVAGASKTSPVLK